MNFSEHPQLKIELEKWRNSCKLNIKQRGWMNWKSEGESTAQRGNRQCPQRNPKDRFPNEESLRGKMSATRGNGDGWVWYNILMDVLSIDTKLLLACFVCMCFWESSKILNSGMQHRVHAVPEDRQSHLLVFKKKILEWKQDGACLSGPQVHLLARARQM